MITWIICTLALIVVCVVALLFRKSSLAQNSADADGIDRLARAGSDLTQSRAIEFLFYFPVFASAENASAQLRADGYEVAIQKDATGTRCVLHATHSMIPRLADLQVLRSTLNDLAAREGGLYEGWTAEVIK